MPVTPPQAAEPSTELSRITRPLRLSEEVSGDLLRRIARGELKPGDRLPTEKALGEAFGVSRAVVREAVARLKADGLIETRQGSGAFVVEAPKTINLRFWQGAGPELDELRDIFELRAMVEERAAVRYVRHNLDSEEVRSHIAGGKSATRLALTWNDRVSFVLTEQLQIKRLVFLDLLKEDAERQAENADDLFAADFTLMCGELAQLLEHLLEVLGGEGE